MTGQQKDNTQATQQQNMNAQPAQQAPQVKQPTIKDANGNDIPFFAAPRSHSSDALSRLAVRAREQSRKNENPGIPTAATPEALASAKYMPMPAGGLSAVVDSLFPQDRDNQDAMDGHLFDLLLLNRDTLRDDTSFTVGQMVRIPG